MVTANPFLTPEEAKTFKERLLTHRDVAWKNKLDLIFGAAGISGPEQRFSDHEERIVNHNAFMKTVFPDLLIKLTDFFESTLKAPCTYTDELSYPGFHLFTIPARTSREPWFHYDSAREVMIKYYPHYGVDLKSRQLTFTCLIDSPPGLVAGLRYFPDSKKGFKVIHTGVTRDVEIEKLADFHQYACGEMNFYEGFVHSIAGRNDSDVPVDRITIQGHVLETRNGYLLLR